ncbi:MAG: putative porin [Nevskiaceae bacterium]|jgi:hypothetical protein|nr:putative porin [Nevskiaceae bacterium]
MQGMGDATRLAVFSVVALAAMAGASSVSHAQTWVPEYAFNGDIRLRDETIGQQFAAQRHRDRIRARAGVTAKVHDTLRAQVELATAEGNDPRSMNVTLSDLNSLHDIDLNLAYVEWAAGEHWKLTAGKMRQPWVRAGQSVLIDADINPRGVAVNWAQRDWFAVGFHEWVRRGSAGDRGTVSGGQFGWRRAYGDARVTLGAGYYDYASVRGNDPFFSGSNGNTTGAAPCRSNVAACLTQDYDIAQVFAEWSRPLAGHPLALYVDVMNNRAARNGRDLAWSAGASYGKASDARTWEIGYLYQHVGKDAVFGQWIDSDFGDGRTDARGSIVKLGYAPVKNWALNVSYQFSDTNIDAPATVAGVGPVFNRDYTRLQVDLNYRF